MKIAVIVENHALPGHAYEHGLSLWMETRAGNALFDTGQGPAFEANIRSMGIPLETARAIVLSHGHYDHSGGLPHALESAAAASLHVHPEAVRARFSVRDNVPKPNGMPAPARRALQAAGGRILWTSGPAEIFPGLHVTGPIPRRTVFEDTGGPFFLDGQGLQPDSIPDDQALWVETPRGLVVFLGCAHSGVVNTLDYVRTLTGQPHVHAVVGGMHLAAASLGRIEETVKALEHRKVQVIAPCHCTGEEAIRFLRRRLPGRVASCSAGERMVI